MSIENNLKKIADGIEKNNQLVEQLIAMQSGGQPVQPVAPPVQSAAPVAPAAPAPTTSDIPPAPTVPGTSAPFTDGLGLGAYVQALYQELGPEKGAGIFTVLQGLGYANINDVQPAHYDALYTQCEALKAA